MSKAQLRVHQLAKEIGVSSKDIIAKCAAEGIELSSHMAPVSAGLAESIREWFSTAGDVTSVEAADPVDLTKVKKRRPSKAKVKEEEDTSPESAAEEAPEEPAVAEPIEPVEEEPAPEIPEISEPVAAPAIPVPAKAPEVVPIAAKAAEEPLPPPPIVEPIRIEPPEAPRVLRPAAVVAPPPPMPREPIVPAGPRVVPKPAELKGPRVVRIEAPEPVRAPRPRTAAVQAPAGPAAPATDESRRVRGKPGLRGRTEEEEAARLRSRSPRRTGRTVDTAEKIKEYRDQDMLEMRERIASATGQGMQTRKAIERRRRTSTQTAAPTITARKAAVEIIAPLSLKAFCSAVGVPFSTIAPKVMQHSGKLPAINTSIDAEMAEFLALELGVQITVQKARTALEELQAEFDGRERDRLQPRPPVVAMLGHVDHGKTSLLDAIRTTDVAAGEAGGITQHIGAYRIDRGDWHVTFLDTPGHEAFTAMRARGANLTDVVVLVVAATDGVMPQTIEAINHARAAGVQIVVALNKIDVQNVDKQRVFGQLAEQGLTPSEWGGETDVIETSGTKKIGIDELIHHLSTLTEILDLKADPTVPARGTVIEAQMREGQGVVAQVLVQEGTLKTGQIIVCGPAAGKVRMLRDDKGRRLDSAGPGTPVEISGLDELPSAGDPLYQLDDLTRAKDIALEVKQARRESTLRTAQKPRGIEALLGAGEQEVPELNIIIKADVQGSIETLQKALGDFPADKARLRILHAGVGAISEADIHLAQASNAIAIGFHVTAEDRARQLAEQVGVEIRLYRVIYEILDDVKKALAGLLEPIKKEETRGTAEVRQIFNVTRFGTIAGCRVASGVIQRSHRVRLIRDGRIVLASAAIGSLRRVKDDVREVRAGLECGIKIQDYDDIKPGDVIEAFEVVDVAQVL